MGRFGRALRWGAGILLWFVVSVCIAATILPFFLDRIYYHGPVSAHYDGQRFFNPDKVIPSGFKPSYIWKQLVGDPDRPWWPGHVRVHPAKPAARVAGGAMQVTWIGHATLLVQADGLNILTDPVWTDTAGPFEYGPRRVAEPGVRFEDLPRIDLVLLSHNHYDHFDLTTLKRLWARDRPLIVTSLGNDAILRSNGVEAVARDWGGRVPIREGIDVAVTRNHHWGSRWGADRNRALWSSFVVRLPHGNFFFAGDTGPGDLRWPEEAARLGPIRLAAIPIGAFRFSPGQMVSDAHIGPRDALRVWNGLGRPRAIPIHWGTFRLSYEGWDTPPRMLRAMQACAGVSPGRFAPSPIGVTVAIPALSAAPPPADMTRLAACEAEGRFADMR